MKFRKAFHFIAQMTKPVLAIFGVKEKTIANKTAEAIKKADDLLQDEQRSKNINV